MYKKILLPKDGSGYAEQEDDIETNMIYEES